MSAAATYLCPTCHQRIEVYIDTSVGPRQEYTEDCSVCCRPNVLRISVTPTEDPADDPEIWIDAESES